jgi:hypothetical protein
MTEKRVKAAINQAVYYRNYRRVRDRALTRLAAAYPDDYKELLEQEKANDEQMGKKWLDIDGTTGASDVGLRPITTAPADQSPDNNRTHKSNYGGEA